MRVEKKKSPRIGKNIKPLANTSLLPLLVLQYTSGGRKSSKPERGIEKTSSPFPSEYRPESEKL